MSNMNDMGSLRTPICDLLGCRCPVIRRPWAMWRALIW